MLKLEIHLETGRELHGRVVEGDETGTEFSGWIQLVALLERVRAALPKER
jgi:hypothetical protein